MNTAASATRTAADLAAVYQALDRVQAIIEFELDGTVISANQNFLDLQDELSVIEDKIAAARRFYNSAVQDYNTAREQFPGSLVAGSFNFEPREFFDLGEDRVAMSTPPEVKF